MEKSNHINLYDISRLRNLPIEQIAEACGLTVLRHKCLCPFHDDTHPSLTIYARRNRYHCFACGAKGNTIDLVMKVLGMDFKDACHWLAARSGVVMSEVRVPVVTRSVTVRSAAVDSCPDLPYLQRLMAHPVLNPEARAFLFKQRRLKPEVVSWLGISSITHSRPMSRRMSAACFDGPALLIPYKDIDGQLVSVQSRYLGQERRPRFRFPAGSHCHIFNLPVLRLLEPGDELWITEGVTDCMAMLSTGRKAVAIPSATMLKEHDVRLIREAMQRVSGLTLHIAPDNDEPGTRLYMALKERLPELQLHLLPSGTKDFGEYYSTMHSSENRQATTN